MIKKLLFIFIHSVDLANNIYGNIFNELFLAKVVSDNGLRFR